MRTTRRPRGSSRRHSRATRSTISSIAVGSPTARRCRASAGSMAGTKRIVRGAADTSLTPGRRRRSAPYTPQVLEISVLGPLEVRRDGTPVPVPGGKSAELLVRLTLDAGELVRTDRLIDEVWPAEVDTRRNTVQSKVTRLRRAFGDPTVVVGRDDGYVLTVDPGHIDAFVVSRDAVASARLLLSGDHRGAADLSASALARFSGTLVPTAGDADWVAPHRVRLSEVRLQLTETHLAARLDLGAGEDVIGDLEAAVARVPLPRSALAAADHRPLPRRAPGRRARGSPASAGGARRRARPRTRSGAPATRAADSRARRRIGR